MEKMMKKEMKKMMDKTNVAMMAHQGASMFLSGHSNFPAQNPITRTGGEVLESMKSSYGAEKGKQVFYASIRKGTKGSKRWERHTGK